MLSTISLDFLRKTPRATTQTPCALLFQFRRARETFLLPQTPNPSSLFKICIEYISTGRSHPVLVFKITEPHRIPKALNTLSPNLSPAHYPLPPQDCRCHPLTASSWVTPHFLSEISTRPQNTISSVHPAPLLCPSVHTHSGGLSPSLQCLARHRASMFTDTFSRMHTKDGTHISEPVW